MSKPAPGKLRLEVRQRVRFRCEYCLLHEEDSLYPHEPDHLIARKHRGNTDKDNLAWAFFTCNHLKGSDLVSVDVETGRVVRLFNPRTDRWTRHFRLEGAQIIPLTARGRVTEYLLQFNLRENVELRKLLIAAGRYPR